MRSVFHCELIAIDTGFTEALSIPGSNSIWILPDSRSAIQHLSNWPKVGDNTGRSVYFGESKTSFIFSRDTSKMGSFAQQFCWNGDRVNLSAEGTVAPFSCDLIGRGRSLAEKWACLSHVNIACNEIAAALAKDGAAQPTMNSVPLTYSKLLSTYINNKKSTVPLAHHWYKAKHPGGSLSLQCSRQEQTILTRFRSGHLRTLTFKDGSKVFLTCVRCSAYQAYPEHILDCLGLSKQNLYEDSLMVLDFLRENEIMDLVELG
ncbi:RNase H domain-containing protein [Trichonephila clavipes]|nr:RNase H domain-containing protein [Trichonephila clavipes]